MRLTMLAGGSFAMLLATTIASAQTDQADAAARLKNAQGKAVGQVTVKQVGAGAVIRGELQGLPPGWHAIHFHEVGKCEPDFAAAGSHFNPGKTKHGLEQGPHAGDMANIFVANDGTSKFEFISGHVSVKDRPQTAAASGTHTGTAAPNLLDQDGASVVVHAKADDYHTDPTGNSGDRIACGALVKR
jgi:superoxide dismutase, Cu-Zn family